MKPLQFITLGLNDLMKALGQESLPKSDSPSQPFPWRLRADHPTGTKDLPRAVRGPAASNISPGCTLAAHPMDWGFILCVV